jgi:AraC-like DNA-binding protein
VFNVYDKIQENPDFYRQLMCGDSLMTQFNCLIDKKLEDTWSHYNYIVYVVDGRKIWHTGHGSYDLQKGSCVFVKKGACIVEQFFDTIPCFIFFFLPDDFICDAISGKTVSGSSANAVSEPLIPIADNAMMQSFFQSMMPYFDSSREPDQTLLALKFKELVLTLFNDTANDRLRTYFASLLAQPRTVALQRIMEENFCFNLKLEEFARLSARSLSAFKRDFENLYQTSPGKWLLEKRLNHALHLLTNMGKTAGEAAFESGFESSSHFSRAFRQRFGITPAATKQQMAV